jgi:uncharacterized protein YbaP (TraB family)
MPLRLRLIAAALLGLALVLPGLAYAEAGPFDRGLLWKIERDGAPASYLFGTMHVSDERVTTLPQPVADAFAASRTVALELIVDEQLEAKISKSMHLPAGQSLDKLLTKRQMLLLRDIAAHYAVSPEMFMSLKPWAVWFLFGSSPGERPTPGQPQRQPLDMMLQQAAADAGKKLVALETAEEQIAVFDGLPQEDQLALLSATLETGADAGRYAHVMRNLYLSGNLKGLLQIFSVATDPQSLAAMQHARTRLLDDRNKRMVERMTKLLQKGDAFVAVGAAHLAGEAGLLSLLAQAGWTVTRVY